MLWVDLGRSPLHCEPFGGVAPAIFTNPPLFHIVEAIFSSLQLVNARISSVLSKTKPIVPFSCTPRVQEIHTKADFVHLTPGLLGLGLLFNCHA